MSDKKKSRAFVFEHQGYRVPATSSKKSKKKKNCTKLHKTNQKDSYNTQAKTHRTNHGCMQQKTTDFRKKKFEREHVVWKNFTVGKTGQVTFFCSTYMKQAPRKHDRMTEKDVPTLIHWRKLPNNRKTCSSDCQLSLRGKIPCVPWDDEMASAKGRL